MYVENASSVDPDERAHYDLSKLDLQFFANSAIVVFDSLRVNDSCSLTDKCRVMQIFDLIPVCHI